MNIIMYGADWCHDTKNAQNLLEINNLEYTYYDVDNTTKGEAYSELVMNINNGKRIVPTFLIEGVPLTHPTAAELGASLGIELKESQQENTHQVCVPNFEN